jgi:hypothetical protein
MPLPAASGANTFNRNPTRTEDDMMTSRLPRTNSVREREARRTNVLENRRLVRTRKTTADSPAARERTAVRMTARTLSGQRAKQLDEGVVSPAHQVTLFISAALAKKGLLPASEVNDPSGRAR